MIACILCSSAFIVIVIGSLFQVDKKTKKKYKQIQKNTNKIHSVCCGSLYTQIYWFQELLLFGKCFVVFIHKFLLAIFSFVQNSS